jgi:hypothetical protein
MAFVTSSEVSELVVADVPVLLYLLNIFEEVLSVLYSTTEHDRCAGAKPGGVPEIPDKCIDRTYVRLRMFQ